MRQHGEVTWGDSPNMVSRGIGRVKIEATVFIPFHIHTTVPFPSSIIPSFTLHQFCFVQGGRKTGMINVKSVIGPLTAVILHDAGSESTHPASPCVPTFADAFKFMFHRNSWRVTSPHQAESQHLPGHNDGMQVARTCQQKKKEKQRAQTEGFDRIPPPQKKKRKLFHVCLSTLIYFKMIFCYRSIT